MKYYLLIITMMFSLGLAATLPVNVLAADAPAAESGIQTVHLNKATAVDLQVLPGIGPALSERIVIYRDENGPFKTIDDLTSVKGIGQAKLAKFRQYLSVN